MKTSKLFILAAVIFFAAMGGSGCAPPVQQARTQPIQQFFGNEPAVQGQSLYNSAKYAEAAPFFQQWVQSEPDNWLSHNWLGWTYVQLERCDDAIASLRRANDLKADKSNFEGLGLCHYRKGLYGEATGFFRMWVELDPMNGASHGWLGWSHLRLKQYQEAIASFQKANAIKKESGHFQGLGQSYYGLKAYDHAIDALEAGLAIAPEAIKRPFKFDMALCYIAKKNYAKAAQLLDGKRFLGVEVQKHKKGFEIRSVMQDGPADLAGIRAGDVLTEFNGEDLADVDIPKFVKEMVPNTDEAIVKFLRRNTLHNVTLGMDLMKLGTPKTAERKALKPAAAEAFTGEKWAVIVGVSRYRDSRIPSLRYASKDATALYNWLVSPDGGRYSPSRVKLLTDASATNQSIKHALFDWLKQAIAEDMVIIYFAGHGSPPSPDEPQNLFLLAYDTDYDAISSSGFPMWDVETALKRFVKAERVVVIADACHAGGVGSAFVQGRRAVKVNPTTATALQSLTNIGKGIAVITASDDKQLSQEGQQWGGGHGVFTYHLLEGLKGEADYNNDKVVTLGELIPYLSQSVRRATQNAQSPTVAGRFDPAITVQK
jgi:uncharacterized caspase-like protein/Flp pilus assembly protein TadD